MRPIEKLEGEFSRVDLSWEYCVKDGGEWSTREEIRVPVAGKEKSA